MSELLFFSYSYRDRLYAHELAKRLEVAGMRPWLFERDEVPAAPYREQLMAAIASAAAVLVVVSARSVISKAVEEEIDYARARGKPLIPVQIEPCAEGPVKMLLGRLNWVDAQVERYPIDRIVAALGYIVVEAPPAAVLRASSDHWSHVSPPQTPLRIPAHILAAEPDERPREHTLCTIGLLPDRDMTVKLAGKNISRNHAQIIVRWQPEGGWMFLIKDTSKNGTYLNGRRVVGAEPLRDGDLIGLVRDNVVLEFGLLDDTKTTFTASTAATVGVVLKA